MKFTSRKFVGWLATSAMLLAAGYLLPVAALPSVVSGLVLVFGAFVGGNVGAKLVAAKAEKGGE